MVGVSLILTVIAALAAASPAPGTESQSSAQPRQTSRGCACAMSYINYVNIDCEPEGGPVDTDTGAACSFCCSAPLLDLRALVRQCPDCALHISTSPLICGGFITLGCSSA